MLKKTSAAFGSAVLVFATAPSAVMMLAEHWWLGEAATTLRFHVGLVAVFALPFLAFGGSRWRSLLATFVAVAQLAPGVSLSFGVAPDAVGGPELRVVYVNVLASSREGDRVAAMITRERPDVIAVVELQPYWAGVFGGGDLGADYPHRMELPRPGDAGVAIYSRYPIVESEDVQIGRGASVVGRATVDVSGCAVDVVVANAPLPTSRATVSSRDELLRRAGAFVDASKPAVLAAGLGSGAGTPALREVLSDNGLVDSRAGTGRQATWMPIFGPLGFDLDHVLVSDGVGVRGHRVLRSIGSDHSPIAVDLVLDPNACEPVREGAQEEPATPPRGADATES